MTRARPAQFNDGDHVYYFYPRRYTKELPKWQRMYTDPYIVTRILPPENTVIQRSKRKRSRPFVVHVFIGFDDSSVTSDLAIVWLGTVYVCFSYSSIMDIPPVPNEPKTFTFPQRSFGQKTS